MASLAETMLQSQLQATSPENRIDIAGNQYKGAQLAMEQQKIQAAQAQMKQHQQTLQLAKFEKVGGWIEAYGKMPDGGAKKAFGEKFIPSGIQALGLDGLIHPIVNDMVLKDSKMGTGLISLVREGKVPISALGDPEQIAKLYPEALKIGAADEISRISADYPKELLTAQNEFLKEKSSEKSAGLRAGGFSERVVQQVHKAGLDDIAVGQKAIKPLVETTQNLHNAIRLFKEGGATANEFHELQGTVNSNLGIKGTTSAQERSKRMSDSTGIKASEWYQFFTGDTEGVASVLKTSPKLAEQVLNLANMELQNKKIQAKQVIDSNSSGRESFYDAHPDLKRDFEGRKAKTLAIFDDITGGATDTVKFNGKEISRTALKAYVDDPAHAENKDLAAAKKALGE